MSHGRPASTSTHGHLGMTSTERGSRGDSVTRTGHAKCCTTLLHTQRRTHTHTHAHAHTHTHTHNHTHTQRERQTNKHTQVCLHTNVGKMFKQTYIPRHTHTHTHTHTRAARLTHTQDITCRGASRHTRV